MGEPERLDSACGVSHSTLVRDATRRSHLWMPWDAHRMCTTSLQAQAPVWMCSTSAEVFRGPIQRRSLSPASLQRYDLRWRSIFLRLVGCEPSLSLVVFWLLPRTHSQST